MGTLHCNCNNYKSSGLWQAWEYVLYERTTLCCWRRPIQICWAVFIPILLERRLYAAQGQHPLFTPLSNHVFCGAVYHNPVVQVVVDFTSVRRFDMGRVEILNIWLERLLRQLLAAT